MRSLENLIGEIYENKKRVEEEIDMYFLKCEEKFNGYINNDTLTHFIKENYPYQKSKKLSESIKNSYQIENIELDEEELESERKRLVGISKELYDEFKEKETPKISRLISILSKVEKNSKLRTGPVLINKGDYIPPETPNEIQGEFSNVDYTLKENDLDPIEKAIHYHYHFVRIHPFKDGNGRSARLLSNSYLFSNDILPSVIERGERMNYARLLDKACNSRKKTYEPLINLTEEEETLFTYLASKINNQYYNFMSEIKDNKCYNE